MGGRRAAARACGGAARELADAPALPADPALQAEPAGPQPEPEGWPPPLRQPALRFRPRAACRAWRGRA